MSCDPNALVESAKCFQCLNEVDAKAVEIYLLTQIAGVAADPQALIEASKDFQALSPEQLSQIQAYLLCQIANV